MLTLAPFCNFLGRRSNNGGVLGRISGALGRMERAVFVRKVTSRSHEQNPTRKKLGPSSRFKPSEESLKTTIMRRLAWSGRRAAGYSGWHDKTPTTWTSACGTKCHFGTRQLKAQQARRCSTVSWKVLIVQFSTGSHGRDPSTRGAALYLRSEMAPLFSSTANLRSIVENVITGAISEPFQ
jgi:hypothetical protein